MTQPSMIGFRLFIVAGGFLGAVGVMLAAGASHGGNTRLLAAGAALCLAHAPALLAIGALMSKIRFAVPAGLLLIFGTALFTGDMVVRAQFGHGLFSGAAPAGGLSMIAAWLLVALGGILSR